MLGICDLVREGFVIIIAMKRKCDCGRSWPEGAQHYVVNFVTYLSRQIKETERFCGVR
jgi:hypothetical protein